MIATDWRTFCRAGLRTLPIHIANEIATTFLIVAI